MIMIMIYSEVCKRLSPLTKLQGDFKNELKKEQKVPINIYIESLIDKEFSYLSASLPDKRIPRGLLFRKMK